MSRWWIPQTMAFPWFSSRASKRRVHLVFRDMSRWVLDGFPWNVVKTKWSRLQRAVITWVMLIFIQQHHQVNFNYSNHLVCDKVVLICMLKFSHLRTYTQETCWVQVRSEAAAHWFLKVVKPEVTFVSLFTPKDEQKFRNRRQATGCVPNITNTFM